MRILVVSNYFPPHSVGGYDIACEAFVSRLSRRGHEVTVLTSNYRAAGVVAADQAARLLHRPQDTAALPQLLWQERADRRTLRRHLRVTPDVIVASNLLQLFPSLHGELARSGRPLVYFLQDPWIPAHLDTAIALHRAWFESGGGLRGAVRRALGRALVSRTPERVPLRVDHAVYCSHELVRRCEAAGIRPRLAGRVIHNGVDGGAFERPPGSVGGEAAFRLLFVGRIVAEKGVHLAIEAVRLLRSRGLPIRLTIVGIPSYPWQYVDDIRSEVERERGLGSAWLELFEDVPNRDIKHFYWNADALVFPSTVSEGLPMTVLEAMAASLPVVGSITGGTGDVLSDGLNGLTFPAGSSAELSDRLERLCQDRELLRALSVGARSTIRERFDIEQQATRLETFLVEVARHAMTPGLTA